MNIAYLGVKNILGIEAYEYAPGKINLIEGANGQGKTSLLRAIQGVVAGGHDGTLLRNGQDKGEIVLIFDNGMTLKKEVRADKSKVTLTDKEGKKVNKAASFIKEIVDNVGLNPIQLLTAPPKERVKLLLGTIPMEIPADKIEEATGLKVAAGEYRHPLDVIQEMRKKFFDDRTETNRELKEKTVYVDKMREAIPFKKQEGSFKEELEAVLTERRAIEGTMKDELEAQDVLRDRAIEEIREKYSAVKDQIKSECQGKLEALAGREAVARENVLNEDKVAKAVEYVSEGEKEMESLKETSLEYTACIDALDGIKADLLKKLPIDGLEVKDGDIYLDGVAFDSVNESKRIRFALTVAGMRETELPVVCVDGLEALDENSFSLFKKEAEKTKMQFFVTRVTEGRELAATTEPN